MNRAERRRQKKLLGKAPKGNKTPSGENLSPVVQNALNLAVQHQNAGRISEAEGICQQLLASEPNQPFALHLLGVIAYQTAQYATAAAYIGQALTVKPDYPEAHINLGLVFKQRGNLDQAVISFRKAISQNPNVAAAHNNLGNVLKDLNQPVEATTCYQKAVTINPGYAEAHNNLGIVLKDMGKLHDSLTRLNRAIEINPNYAEAFSNLGNTYKELNQLDEAVACYQKALQMDLNFAPAHSNLLAIMPFASRYSTDQVFAASRRAGKALEGSHGNLSQPDDRDPDRRLRIGYLSPSLTEHVLSPYLKPLFEFHRREHMSVHVYAHVPRPDHVTEQLKALADSWTFIHSLTDEQVARKIIDDGIDILVDPMGHWNSNRLSVFARKPAPLQVSYLCQNLTSGLSKMDYIIGDPWLNEGGKMQAFATEKVVELAGGFQTTSFEDEPTIGDVPSEAAGFINFASFNNSAKLSDACLRLWAEILNKRPTSQLLIKASKMDNPEKNERILNQLLRHNISRDRISIMGHAASENHLQVHNQVDVMLDSFPFTGGRTTVDALWMGVPVVTLKGACVYGRYSYSHLKRIGAGELVAQTEEDYVNIALGLADDMLRLRHYRQKLRPLIKASSLLNAAPHVVELEQAYRTIWQNWCAGKEPESFLIGKNN